jgi:hypothetical protein
LSDHGNFLLAFKQVGRGRFMSLFFVQLYLDAGYFHFQQLNARPQFGNPQAIKGLSERRP